MLLCTKVLEDMIRCYYVHKYVGTPEYAGFAPDSLLLLPFPRLCTCTLRAVIPDYTVSPLEGILAAVNGGVLPPRPNNSCALLVDTDFFQVRLRCHLSHVMINATSNMPHPIVARQPNNQCVNVSSMMDCCNLCTSRTGCAAFSFHPALACAGASPDPTSNRCWLKPE